MTDYKATPEQWALCKEFSTTSYGTSYACLLELRAKVEALEANRPEKPDSSDPAGSLVERLVDALANTFGSDWKEEARAAIREVAAWLDENTGGDAAWMLTQEAER
jgi:hypothetical protein